MKRKNIIYRKNLNWDSAYICLPKRVGLCREYIEEEILKQIDTKHENVESIDIVDVTVISSSDTLFEILVFFAIIN